MIFSTEVAHASVDSFIQSVNTQIINPLILFLFALAMVYFLYGMLKFFMGADNDEARSEGKQHMIWGVLGMTIMMGVFAILNLVLDTLNLRGDINVEQGTVNLQPYNPSYPRVGPPAP